MRQNHVTKRRPSDRKLKLNAILEVATSRLSKIHKGVILEVFIAMWWISGWGLLTNVFFFCWCFLSHFLRIFLKPEGIGIWHSLGCCNQSSRRGQSHSWVPRDLHMSKLSTWWKKYTDTVIHHMCDFCVALRLGDHLARPRFLPGQDTKVRGWEMSDMTWDLTGAFTKDLTWFNQQNHGNSPAICGDDEQCDLPESTPLCWNFEG